MPTAARKQETDHSAHLAQDLEEGFDAIKEDVIDTAGKVKDDLNGMAHSAGRKARRYINENQKEFSKVTRSLAELMRDKPIQSGLIAVGAGFLLGTFFRRS
jgi:ElaB/YqjD/DUF883 family membrane-anchored ribosome-binding protein